VVFLVRYGNLLVQLLRPEAVAQAAKLQAEFLARQTAFYSRQLALTSRQHARYVSSVAAAMGEQRGPPIVAHAALAKAALPLPVGAEIMHADRPSSAAVRLSSHVASGSDGEASQVESTREATVNDHKQHQEQGQAAQLPTQQVRHQNKPSPAAVLESQCSLTIMKRD
jgi:hypothetical protein